MIKILLSIAALVVVTLAQDGLEPGQFEIVDTRDDPDNLDADYIAKLQLDSVVKEALDSFDRSDAKKSGLESWDKEGMPPGILAALGNATLASAMLDEQSAINEKLEEDDDTSATTTTPATGSTNQRQGRRALQASSILQKPLWWCPYSRHLLRWFPLRHCGQVTDICFIPWAHYQRITYARCHTKTCRLWNQKPRGQCRPSCYSRRRLFAVCYSLQTRWWYWRWVVLNLPQDCRCSAC